MNQIFILKEAENKINLPSDLFRNIEKIKIDFKQENMLLFCLNTKNQILHSEIIFKGGLNACAVDMKTIYRTALKHNSNSIIIAHNHPSGDLTPSSDDREVFEKIKQAGKIIDLSCIDSIVFNENDFYSMN